MYKFSIEDKIINLTGSVDLHTADGCKTTIDSMQKNRWLEFSSQVFEHTSYKLEAAMVIRNISSEPLYIDCLMPGVIDPGYGGQTFLGIGVQAWTMLAGGIGAGVNDLCDLCFGQKVRDFYSSNYAMFGNNALQNYFFCGFKSCKKQDTRIELHAEVVNIKLKKLLMCCDLAGFELLPGQELVSEVFSIYTGSNPVELIELFAAELQKLYGKREFKNIVGWSGWDFYQRSITEKNILDNVEYLAQHRDTLPIEYIQLDDGYEVRDGDWLLTNHKFPHGLKYLTDKIHAAGFKAGLWLNPFLAAPESQVALQHPEWLLRGKNGEPLILNGYAVREIHGLDCSVPGVTDYLRQLAHTVTVEYGFDYLKLDGANRQILSSLGHPSNPAVGRGEAMRLGLEAFKSGMRSDAVLLNGSIFGISMGISDIMRVGEDAGGRWDASLIAKDHGERDRFNGPGEILRAISAVNNHYYLHKKVWINDPDYLVVRQAGMNSELSLEEARSWASIIALSNGSIILADPPYKLTPERLDVVEKVLPHCQYPARPVDFFRKNVPSVLAMKAEIGNEEYLVVSVTNTDIPKRARDYSVDFAELGLDVNAEYLAFEFWNSEFMGTVNGKLVIKALPPHTTKVIALRKKSGNIQLIGTDSHISMGAIEVKNFDGSMFEFNKRGKVWKAFFYLPDGVKVPEKLHKHSDNCYYLEVSPETQSFYLE